MSGEKRCDKCGLIKDRHHSCVATMRKLIEQLQLQLFNMGQRGPRRSAILKTCTWKWIEGPEINDPHWKTECGHRSHYFYDNVYDPRQEGFDFCPYCSKPIFLEEPEDERTTL